MPDGLMPRPAPDLFDPRLPAHFWDKVEFIPFTGCWIWTGSWNRKGYGHRGFHKDGKKYNFECHRFAYLTLIGEVPLGLELDHLCRVRPCCNPYHLEPVTRSENYRRGDMKTKQTHCRNGHEFTHSNLVNTPKQRTCRICFNARRRKYRARLRKANGLRKSGPGAA